MARFDNFCFQLSVVVALCMAYCPLLAEEAAPGKRADPVDLVARLGDESFGVRESAARELVKLGFEAREALDAGAKRADLEVRLRCREILQSLARTDLERRLAAFIEDVHGRAEHKLPGWEKYRARCGADRAARESSVDLVRAESSLLEELDGHSSRLGQIFHDRVVALQDYFYSGNREQISAASVAALLLVGVEPEVKIDHQAGMVMYNFLSQTNSEKALSEGPKAQMLRGLLEAWVARGNHETLGYYNLMLALRYNLKEAGLLLGRKVLSTPGASQNALQNAIIAVGKYGDKSDLPLILPLLKNSTVCHTWSNPQFKNLIKTEIRDVALVMLLRTIGQEPKDFGFVLLQPNPMTVYQIYSFGFHEPADRDAAFAKWNAFAEKELPK